MEYYILLAIQFLSVTGLTIGTLTVLGHLNNRMKGCLFFYFMVTMFNSAGYLGMMLSRTEGEAVLAQMITYAGRAWVPFAMLLFYTYFCKNEKFLKAYTMVPAALIHFVTYVLVLTSEYQPLYYKNRTFIEDGLFPHLDYDYGIWHNAYNILIMFYAVFALVQMIMKLCKDEEADKRRGTLFMTAALVVNMVFFVLEITGIGDEYDMTQLGYAAAAIFMYIAIIRYDVLDTRMLARDFVIDRLADAIVAIDNSGKLAYYNEPALKLFPGLSKNADSVSEVAKLVEKDEIFEFEGRMFRPRKTPLYRNNHIAGYTYVFTDETERIKYTKDLEEQKQLADAANEAKSDFLARMSHDIRTPINAVLGMDEMILRESEEKQTLEYAEQIKGAGKTLLALVNDILDISKIEEGKMELSPTNYQVAPTIAELLVMFKDRAVEKGLEFELDVDENIPKVLHGDDIRIKQCLINLLSNAIKYTNTGKVRFLAHCVKNDGKNVTVRVSVQDTGIGMKQEDIKQLFEPFVRLNEAKTREIEGTGLGLSIVYRLLKLMNSELHVESEYGKGSEFYFDLEQQIVDPSPIGKVSSETLKKPEENKYHSMFAAPNARVLVVDDNAVNLMVLKGLLKNTQMYVDTAKSGKEAIELFAAGDYDCVFIDHMMPEMDGIETLGELKKSEKAGKVTFVALTANAINGAKEMYLEAGFEDYLSKPVDPKELEKMLIKYLPEDKVVKAD